MINISGVSGSRVAVVAARLIEDKTQNIIIVSTENRGKELAEDLSFCLQGKEKEIIVLPNPTPYFIRYDAKNQDQLLHRLRALKALSTGSPVIVICPVATAIKKIAPHQDFKNEHITIKLGERLDLEEIKEKLVAMGYERTTMVESPGQFSTRGGILDIFTADREDPYRIELFGDEVDSIRSFFVDSQRSIESLRNVEIYPAEVITSSKNLFQETSERIYKEYTKVAKQRRNSGLEELSYKIEETRDRLCENIENVENLQLLENYIHYFYDEPEYIWDYMEDGNILIDDPDRIYELLTFKEQEDQRDFQVLLERGQAVPKDLAAISGKADFKKAFQYKEGVIFTPFPKRVEGISTFSNIQNLESRQPLKFEGKLKVLENELRRYLSNGYDITIVCSSEEKRTNLKGFVLGIDPEEKIHFQIGNLSEGAEFPTYKKVWLCDGDIFKIRKKARRKKYKDKGSKIKSFADMKEGDFVVHENHGVGKFIGIQQLSVEGDKKDYIKIKYAGQDILYVPVEQMDIVQKYIGGDGHIPKINKLTGGEWKVTKAKAKQAIAVMAKDLIDLYAERSMKAGHSFGKDTVWQKDFEESFPYEETEDQLQAVEEIKADMERPFAMDRLLLGDVGFGKTEVAARAIFKCLDNGKQAAVLVPTTILANQHYYTLRERFQAFPFNVEVLSRFRSKSQQNEVVKKLEKGEVDLIIGTHRLLSDDVKFQDLGLLVVDEEQRFGVQAKEKIKKYKTNIDVLTLSATPIPRTLNMSLTGIKDMSLIEEPPEDRYPVQTYVMEQDDYVLKEVIQREVDRGGQVYLVYNRVKGIERIGTKVQKLLPKIRVAVGHGQMNEKELEAVMLNFVNGEYDVLVSTTIIESGLDIPNANTIIIMDADKYGLSQLYQLRGRVGRAGRMAYAYLMYQKNKVLNQDAEKRLKAIREFTEFGAGFKVAMRDLEIRGAGNILGTAQSGHIMNIGYELYCKMVENAVKALQGETVKEIMQETSVEIPVSAYIPDDYIENESLKLEMYKKIASVRNDHDEDDIIDELLDRFGDVPDETINLIKVSHIRYLAEELSVVRIHKIQDKVFDMRTNVNGRKSISNGKKKNKNPESVKMAFDFNEENFLNGFSLLNLNEKFGRKVFVHGGVKPIIRLSTERGKILKDTIEILKILHDGKRK